MGNKFKVEIQETVEELEHRLERAITAGGTHLIEHCSSVVSIF